MKVQKMEENSDSKIADTKKKHLSPRFLRWLCPKCLLKSDHVENELKSQDPNGKFPNHKNKGSVSRPNIKSIKVKPANHLVSLYCDYANRTYSDYSVISETIVGTDAGTPTLRVRVLKPNKDSNSGITLMKPSDEDKEKILSEYELLKLTFHDLETGFVEIHRYRKINKGDSNPVDGNKPEPDPSPAADNLPQPSSDLQ